MKVKISNVAGWMGRLMLIASLVISSAAMALAFDVTGTVTNNSGKSGRIYLVVQNTMYGGTPVAGVSIPTAGAFTIRGLTDPGSYRVTAFVDTQGIGIQHANDPIGTSAVFTDASPSGVNLTLALPSPAIALQPPNEANVIYGDTTATIFYDGASDNNGNPIATSYNVYWSTTDNPGPGNMCPGCSATGIPSGSHDFFAKTGLTSPASQYKFAVTAVLDGSESAPVNAIAAPPTSGVSVSGTITTTGVTLPATGTYLLMVLMDQGAGNFITYSLANPINSQLFTISNVPPGTYSLYTIIDMNNNGVIDVGDIADTNVGVAVSVGGSPVTGVAVSLAAADAQPYVQTKHYNGDSYGLTLGAAGMMQRPVNVAVSGPQLAIRDIGLANQDGFETWQNVGSSRPVLLPTPDSYTFTIEYASGSGASPLIASITGIVDYFATPTTPIGVIGYPAPDPLQFSWTPPAPGPAYPYTYSFWLNGPNLWFNNDPYWNMASSTTSISISGADFSPQQGMNYNWGVSIKDGYGNSSESYANFSAGGSGNISGMVTSDGSHGIPSTFAVLLDSITGKPVSTVPAVQTDSNSGSYFFNSVPTGNYKLYFSAGPGYQSEFYNDQTSFNSAQLLTVNNGDNIFSINATLASAPNTGTIAGRVVNTINGQPVTGALVELYSTGNSPLGTSVYTTSSGDFQISALNPGSYKLRISANGYKTILPVTQYLVQSGVITQAPVSLSNTVVFTSRVVDSSNAGIDGALVEVVGGTASVTTEGGGYFSLTVPVSTSFYLRISKATYVTTYTSTLTFGQDSNSSDRPYTLLTSSGYDAMFTPASPDSVARIAGTGSISSRVASAANPLMTLPGVSVTASDGTNSYQVCYNDGSVDCGTYATTRDNGRFYVLNVPDGTQITVTATKSGYNSGSRVFTVVADSVTQGRVGMQTSSPSYTMISRLVDFNTGAPVANNTVTLFNDGNSTIGQLSTDSNGLFTAADLVSGNYYLQFSGSASYLESYSSNTSAPAANVDRSNRPYYMFRSSPSQLDSWGFGQLNAVITGTIKDGLTGAPIAGATVSSPVGTVVYDDGTGNPSGSATGTPAANGRFYVYGIPSTGIATTVTVTVQTAPGHNLTGGGGPSRVYHVLNNRITQGSFNFPQSFPPTMVNVSGSVSDRSNLPLSGARVAAYFLSPWSMISTPVVSDSNGRFSLNVPNSIPFALEFISSNYRSAYSQDLQLSQPSGLGAFPLLTNNDYSLLGWPLTAGKTFIRGLALDNLGRLLDGVLLTPTPGTYTVNYVNDSDNKTLMTGGATFTNGLFVLKDAAPSDYVSLSATKSGKSFYPISFSHMVADTDSLGAAIDSTPAPGFLNASPSFLDFGSITVGSGPFTQNITLNNFGPGNISVSSFSLSGHTGDFSIVPGGSCPTLPGTLPPGNCTVQINFSPTTSGQRSATLTIISDASSGPMYTVSFSGNGQATFPGAPTITSVTPWDGQATVNFNPPAFDGGSQITGYSVSVTPGPISFTVPGPASPITVSGLTNGVEYSFWIAAINVVGTGPDSTPAAVATPYFAPIRINTTGYVNLDGAVTASSAGDTIMLQQSTVPVTLSTPYTITKGIKLFGGYNGDYSNPYSGSTVIPGRLTIKPVSGQVYFRNIVVKAVP